MVGVSAKAIRDRCRKGDIDYVQARKKASISIPRREVRRLLGHTASEGSNAEQPGLKPGEIYEVWDGFSTRYLRATDVRDVSSLAVDFGPMEPFGTLSLLATEALRLGDEELALLVIQPIDDLRLTLTDKGDEPEWDHPVAKVLGIHSSPSPFWLYGRNQRLRFHIQNPRAYSSATNHCLVRGAIAQTTQVGEPKGGAVLAITRRWT